MRITALVGLVMSLMMLSAPSMAEDGYAVLSTPIYREEPAPLQLDGETSIHEDLIAKLKGLSDQYYSRSRNLSYRFAGKYMVWLVGCGGGLTCGVLMDLETGRPVIRLPDTVTGYKFSPDRHVMWVDPYQSDLRGPENDSMHVYLWIGEQMVHIDEVEPWPAQVTTGATN